ncbi:hypothetical protein BpHYR1_032675 [Brachionus plicatilis]|uniref:RNA-directed DNA polymerase from mobile element jockey-like n=1 Tax=Brachionus plicatilis TaxID=10195 RepID=A0A3M7PT79_BRAPC|nr:hypothetical protein BpHYR1_032675 [Brachionus plicatilis]
MLKNLPQNTLNEITFLFNTSLEQGRVPSAWKTAYLTMIPKKSSPSQDPSNYRPIISNRLFELSERYVRAGLSHSVPLVIILVNEYREGFESRFIEYPTPLCNCYLNF